MFDSEEFKGLTSLEKGEYDSCTFTNCSLPSADLSGCAFTDCEFESCDLSAANLQNTAMRDVRFISCKLLGLQFAECNEFLFSVGFDSCQLNLSSFYQLNLKKASFKNCSLHEVDFTEANLAEASFQNADLLGAMFDRTNLEKADLSSAENYEIDPENNKIKKAKFALPAILGLLRKYDIKIG